MLLGKTQFAGKIVPYNISVQQRYRPFAQLQKTCVENLGDGRFAGTRKARQKQRQALFARRRVGFLDLFDDIRKGRPIRYSAAIADTLPDIRA